MALRFTIATRAHAGGIELGAINILGQHPPLVLGFPGTVLQASQLRWLQAEKHVAEVLQGASGRRLGPSWLVVEALPWTEILHHEQT